MNNNNDYADFENSMKLIQEYSSDQFTKSKKEDVLEVKRLSNIRKQIKENVLHQQKGGHLHDGNKRVRNMSCSNLMEKTGVGPYAQLANDLKIMNKRRSTAFEENLVAAFTGYGQDFVSEKKKKNHKENVIEEEVQEAQEAQEVREGHVPVANFAGNTPLKSQKIGSCNYFYWSNKRSAFKLNEDKRRESKSSLNIFSLVDKANIQNYSTFSNNINNNFNLNSSNINTIESNVYSDKRKISEFESYNNTEANLFNSGDISKLNSDLIMRDARKKSKMRRSIEKQLELFNRESYSDNDTNLHAKEDQLINENHSNISENEKSWISKSKSSNSDNHENNDNNKNNNSRDDSCEIVNKVKQIELENNKNHRFSISRYSIFKSTQSFLNNNNINNNNNNSIINNNNSNNNNNNNVNYNLDYNFPALIMDSSNNSIKFEIEKYFKKFDSHEFNVFEYAEACGRENVLINISDYLFEKNSLYVFISKKRFETFIDKIRLGYDNLLPYHNDLHAVDVLQTCSIFMQYLDLIKSIQLTFLDVCGFLIAAIIHDFKHPGLNNSFQINKKTKIATRYNDVSVLENYHVSAAFKIISKPNSNIFKDLHVEEYRVVRKRIVECVLATDMAKHMKAQTSLRMKLESLNRIANDFNLDNDINNLNKEEQKNKNLLLENLVNNLDVDNKFDRQQEILNFLIHSADISNPTKPFSICKAWTDLVMEEFFMQGDLEKKKGLPVSFLCDRSTTNIPKSQIGFITNIVMPNFKMLGMLSSNCDIFVDNLLINIENWKKEDEKLQLKTAAVVGKSPVVSFK